MPVAGRPVNRRFGFRAAGRIRGRWRVARW